MSWELIKIKKFNFNHLNVSTLMEQYKNQFTKSEQKLYHYIVNNFEKIIYQSLTEIANSCEVGEATALRFCRKLGYKGYQEFKLSIAREMSSREEENNDETYIDKVKSNTIKTIENTYQLVHSQNLQEAVDTIFYAESVIVYGVSSSGIAGLDMQNRLMRIGINIETITDPHNQMIRSNSVTNKTVVIAISLTGSTKDIVDAIQVSKRNGATVLSITNYTESPLAKFSDIVLLTSAKENPLDSGSLTSKISQLYVIDLLCTGIFMKDYKEFEKTKEKVAETISEKLY